METCYWTVDEITTQASSSDKKKKSSKNELPGTKRDANRVSSASRI